MFFSKIQSLIILFLLLTPSFCNGQLLAFPDAKGAGKFAEGGRGGDVIFVTNLNDDGDGSLRSACESVGPRTVIFKIGGTIILNSTIEILNPNITIAGQTAPGGGICLRMNPESTSNNLQATLAILADHVIIRGVRFRAGPNILQTDAQIHDCLDIWDGENIILDHCSFTWGEDENIAIWSDIPDEHPQKITIQHSIIGQGLQKLENGNVTRGYGMLVGGSIGSTDVSIIENLFIHNTQRNPLLKSEQVSTFELNNNVIYNYGFFGTDFSDDVNVNLVANFYLEGNNTSTNRYEVLVKDEALIYLEGNIGLHRPNNTLPEWDIVGFNGTIPPAGYSESPAPLSFQSNTPFIELPDQIKSANDVYDELIDQMDIGANFKLNENGTGEFVSNLDAVDQSLLQDLITNSGTTIFDTDIGNTIQYPLLVPGVLPIDTDNDGMPNVWEESCGLDINDPSDRNDLDNNSYTNLENYLNGVNCSTTTSVTNLISIDHIKIYPCPIINEFSLEGELSNFNIDVLNSMGTIVKNIKPIDNIKKVNINDFPSGVYFLRLINKSNNELHVERIIKL